MYRIPVNQTIKNHIIKMVKEDFYWDKPKEAAKNIKYKENDGICEISIMTKDNIVYGSNIDLINDIQRVFDLSVYITTSCCKDGHMAIHLYWNKVQPKKSEQ